MAIELHRLPEHPVVGKGALLAQELLKAHQGLLGVRSCGGFGRLIGSTLHAGFCSSQAVHLTAIRPRQEGPVGITQRLAHLISVHDEQLAVARHFKGNAFQQFLRQVSIATGGFRKAFKRNCRVEDLLAESFLDWHARLHGWAEANRHRHPAQYGGGGVLNQLDGHG